MESAAASQKGFDMKALSEALSNMPDTESEFGDVPEDVKEQVSALSLLQKQYRLIDNKFHEEMRALEAKYAEVFGQVHLQRKEIVSGAKGVPDFWATVLSNHPAFQSMIKEHDIDALSAITDIRVELLSDNDGFKIVFEFAENSFFTNKTLSKAYYLERSKYNNDVLFDHSIGCSIDWKENKSLSQKVVTKTQRHKSSGDVRTVKKLEEQESFFDFFKTPVLPSSQEEFDSIDPEELEESLQIDFQRGEIIKSKLVPNALDWFTGRALEYEDLFDDEDEEGDDYSECADEECDSHSEEAASSKKPSNKAQNSEQCKQQ